MTRIKKEILFSLFLLAIILSAGCSHKVLTVFFDGVPESADTLKKSAVKPVVPGDSLLAQANEGAGANARKTVHPPFRNKKCALCHNPDAFGKFQLPQPALCYVCHDDYSQNFKFVHGPAAGGYCTACHNPHQSELKKLLRKEGQALCLDCHTRELIFREPAHEKTGDTDCITCHNPHGGNKRFFLAENEN